MSKRVVVTGMAMASPLGCTVESSFNRLHTLENCVQHDESLSIYKGGKNESNYRNWWKTVLC